MLSLIRPLSAPLLSLFFLMMGSGLFNTFVSIRMEIEHYSHETIGIVTSAMYFGILLGSLWMDRWISRIGHIRSFAAIASFLTLLVLLQSLWMNPWYWAILRCFGGICIAGVFIVIESWLLMETASNMRGSVLSVYLAVLYGALSSGQFLLDLADPHGFSPFGIIALLIALSILPVTLQKTKEPKISESARLNLSKLYRLSPLGFAGGIISGMVLAVIYGFVPVHVKGIGMNLSELGTFMAVLIFGGFSLQWPVGRWADKTDRRKVINTISFITAFLAIGLALIEETSVLLCLAWLFGGFSFTIYPVSMAHTCEKLKEEEIVAATGGFVLSYGLGAIIGPLLAPFAMAYLGTSGVFYFIALISLTLGLISLKKPSPAAEEIEK